MTATPPPPNRYPTNQADHSERGYQRLQLRHDTEENWLKNDPILARGEMAYTIAGAVGACLKVGDGNAPWSQLPYLADQGQTGPTGPRGLDGHGITVYGPSDRPPADTNTSLYSGDVWLCSTPGYPGNPSFDAKVVTPGAKGDKGDAGQAATINIGRVVSVGPASPPNVINVGTPQAAVFDFALQQGAKGDQGIQGIVGPKGDTGSAGETFKISGAVASAAALPVAPPHLAVYIASDTAHLYIYDVASAAANAQGYVDLGAIQGAKGESFHLGPPVADAAALPAVGSEGQCVQTLDDGHLHAWDSRNARWVDGGQWRGPAGSGIADGTAAGQVPVWDALTHSWVAKAAPKSVPDGTADKQILSWDQATKAWITKAVAAGKFRGALDLPPRDGQKEEAYYLIADATVSDQPAIYPLYVPNSNNMSGHSIPWNDLFLGPLGRLKKPDPDNPGADTAYAIDTTNYIVLYKGVNYHLNPNHLHVLTDLTDKILGQNGQTAATNFQDLLDANLFAPMAFGVPWDKRMLGPLQAGAKPDPTDPSQPMRDSVGSVVPLDPSWKCMLGGVVFHCLNTARLIQRINAGETDPAQWFQGANAPVTSFNSASVSQAKQGWYYHDGSKWTLIPSTISSLTDVDVVTTPPTAGQVLTFDATANKWKPGDSSSASPIVYLGTGAWDNTAALDGTAPLYGMPTGTTPSPTDYPPIPGDSYIDLATGHVTTFTGTATTTRRTPGSITGGGGALDIIKERLQDLDDVSLTAPANGNVLTYDSATSKWENKPGGIPLHLGAFSVGSKSGNTYTPPATPAEGDIWVDKNPSTPVFKQWRSGAWVLVDWQKDHLGLLSDLANVSVGMSGSPGQGDALIFNQLTEQWESGAVPAHIAEYGNTINYSAGTTVYYKGGLFEAKERTSGVSPAFQYGDCWLYHRAQFTGAGDWVGPVSFETVTQVADVTVAPAATHPADDLRPHWTLLWKSDSEFSIWQWELSMRGWTPGSPAPTAQWHRYETQFTKPNAARIWRNYSTPPQHIGDCVVWIYDDPKGTNVPHYRDFPWILRPIRSDLISMHDVKAETPPDQSVLIWDNATSYWEAKVPPYLTPATGYTKAEVDTKFSSLVTGLEHEESVLSITATPPSAPNEDDLYIVATGATGAWVGHVNELALWDNGAWKFATARANETHLIEDQSALFHWNGTAWVKIASTAAAAGVSAQSGVGEIIAWPTDTFPTTDYLECDGRVIAIAAYADLHTAIGNAYNAGTGADGTTTFALPDLRGYFLRGTGANGGEAHAGVKQDDTTRLPRTPLVGTISHSGSHHHTGGVGGQINSDGAPNWKSGFDKTDTGEAGDHTHTITFSGGDLQTRPISSSVKWLIRFRPINGGAKGDKGDGVPATAAEGQTLVRRSNAWVAENVAASLALVGDIKHSILTEPQFKAALGTEADKWVLADGRDVTGTTYATITGHNNVPDLRGAFLRGAGQNNNAAWTGGSLGSYQEDSTKMPNTAFTAQANGNHRHNLIAAGGTAVGAWQSSAIGIWPQDSNWGDSAPSTVSNAYTGYAGDHSHTILGGDTETRPKNYAVNFFIRVKA